MAMNRTRLLRQRAGIVQASIGSYRAAENPRTRAPYYWGGSGDVHADHRSRRIIREMTRHLERNSHTWGILHDRWLDDLGTPDPRFNSKDESWNARMHDRWQAKRARTVGGWDSRQLVNFDGWFRLFAGSVGREGDAAVVKVADGTWSMVESDRIDGPTRANQYATTQMGLTLNQAGAITQVWICPTLNGFPQITQAKPYPIEQVEFCAHRKRYSQTRGMPPLVAGIDDFERGDSLLESTVIQAEQAANVYGVIKKLKAEIARAQNGAQAIQPITKNGNPAAIDAGASNVDQVPDYVAAARGALLMLYEDQEFNQIKNENPNLNVPPFMQFLLRLHALGLSYPYELAFMDMNGNSWSNGKMLITLARNGMNRWRGQTFEPVLTNLCKWQVQRWAREFGEDLPEDWDRITWAWPEIPWPDPHKEELTNKLSRENGTTSTRRLEPEWRRVFTEISEEDRVRDALNIERIAQAQALCNQWNAKVPGLDLRWPHIVSLVGATSTPGAYLQASSTPLEKPGDDPAAEPAKSDQPPADPPAKQ